MPFHLNAHDNLQNSKELEGGGKWEELRDLMDSLSRQTDKIQVWPKTLSPVNKKGEEKIRQKSTSCFHTHTHTHTCLCTWEHTRTYAHEIRIHKNLNRNLSAFGSMRKRCWTELGELRWTKTGKANKH